MAVDVKAISEKVREESAFVEKIQEQIRRVIIGQQDVGAGRCGAGKGDTLLFATRQLRGVMLAAVRQADRVKLLGGALECVWVPGQFQRCGDVFKRRHRGNQVKGLKHNAEMITPQPRQLILVHN